MAEPFGQRRLGDAELGDAAMVRRVVDKAALAADQAVDDRRDAHVIPR
jgi:hypothetical protein